MDTTGKVLNLDDRLRRSLGRTGRVIGVSVKVTRDERNELERVARQEGQALGEWAREVLLREARRSQDDPVFTEIIGTRILLNEVLRHLALASGMTLDKFVALLESIRNDKRMVAREVLSQYTTNLSNKEL